MKTETEIAQATSLNPPGHPGIPSHWTSSAKTGVGTPADGLSHVWFTISHGVINEIYFPAIDQANTKDLQFLVSDGLDFFSEEQHDTNHHIEMLSEGVPAYKLTNTCKQKRYRIVKNIIGDPDRDILLQQIRFEPLPENRRDLHVYVLLRPHVHNQGGGNNGWVDEFKGTPVFLAQRENTVLALACSAPFRAMSCGYMGTSDGLTDIRSNKRMTYVYPQAADGVIALTGEIDIEACGGSFVLSLAFGQSGTEAAHQARAGLLEKFETALHRYVSGWHRLQGENLKLGASSPVSSRIYRVSAAVLRTHDAKVYPGGMIASLSIPWGSRADGSVSGYHLVWPRDLVEGALGTLAEGNVAAARQTFFYMMCTQEADGHWPQNMWTGGRPQLNGIQLDGTGLGILLADKLRRMNALDGLDAWLAVRRAAGFLVRHGPATMQDRWEENSGYSPFTLAVMISALLAAADFAEAAGETPVAHYLRETADIWNENIERWTYVEGTELARRTGVEGYYIRIAPPEVIETGSAADLPIKIRNRADMDTAKAGDIVSPDALALVRYGLRGPADPRVCNTIKVIDATLKSNLPTGPVWHRYRYDGYGEKEDGSAFDGTGVGRGWPLLTGERAHYELAAGNRAEARRLAAAMEAMAGPTGLIPEQVWDGPDIPEKELYNGRPSGSAMPLVWAHSEYMRLLRSLEDGHVFDTPPQTVERYLKRKVAVPIAMWRFDHQIPTLAHGQSLRVEVSAPAMVHWSGDEWRTFHDVQTTDSGLGPCYATLDTSRLAAGRKVLLTFYWPEIGKWEESTFEVTVK